MNHALDACAMIAYLRGEPGSDIVGGYLQSPTDRCYAHTINLIEVYYDFVRSSGEPFASQALADLAAARVFEQQILDSDFVKQVGQLKASGRISLADCFCIALAHRIGGDVVTSDHHEFDMVAQSKIVPVLFIRRNTRPRRFIHTCAEALTATRMA